MRWGREDLLQLDTNARALLAQLYEAAGDTEDRHDIGDLRRRFEALITEHDLRDIPIKNVTDIDIAGPAGPLRIRVFEPIAPPDTRLPILIYFHGGGFVAGSPRTHEAPCRTISNCAQCLVVSVDYRLLPEHGFPAALDDCVAAVEWVAGNAESLGGDSARLAVGGDSAGGNLAAVLCQIYRDRGASPISFQLLFYPLLDFLAETRSRRTFATGYGIEKAELNALLLAYAGAGGDLADPRISPARALSMQGLPPAYVVAAGFDPLRDEARDYATALTRAGCSATFRLWSGQIHGFCSFSGSLPEGHAALVEAATAMRGAFEGNATTG